MLAGQFATPAPSAPEQAWLRRSISTAYYALFHRLVQESAKRWNGSTSSQLGLERTFKTEVAAKLSDARASFQKWDKINGTSVADEFLLSLMIGTKRG